MTNENASAGGTVRDIPIDWEALEDAFENNAPEVHSYLHLVTGDVLRVVDGVADPQMHARIAADANYLRIDPVSSREQYRWMERYIPMVEDPDLQGKLSQAIDGKGAFRRFKDVLMAYAPERERWFAFRSERLRVFMEAWLEAHALRAVPRPVANAAPPPAKDQSSEPPPVSQDQLGGRRTRNAEWLRRQLKDVATTLGARDLDRVLTFAEFVKARRVSRGYSQRHDSNAPEDEGSEPRLRSSSAPPSSSPEDGRAAEKTLPS